MSILKVIFFSFPYCFKVLIVLFSYHGGKNDMDEQKFNLIFARNLRSFLSINKMTQVELAKKLNVGTTSVYNWCNGIKLPRMDKVDKMCDLFSCRRSDLITDESDYPAEPVPLYLSDIEIDIIKAYRRCSPELKAALHGFLGLKGEAPASGTAEHSIV